MKLTLRISLLLAVVMALVLAAVEGMAVLRESDLLLADVHRDARLVAESLATLVAEGRHDSHELTPLLSQVGSAQELIGIAWRDAGDPRLPAGARQALQSGEVVVSEVPRKHTSAVVAWAPVDSASGTVGVIQVTESLAGRDAFIRRSITTAGASILGVTLLTGLAALGMGRIMVGRRIDRLVDKTRQVARNDLLVPVQISGRDELTQLAHALNAMSSDLDRLRRTAEEEAHARLAAEVALQHADRLRTVGVLAAGLAHELGTPLNVISGRAALIERRQDADDRVRANAQVIREQTDRITRLVRLLMDFSRASELQVRTCALDGLVRENLELLASEARKHGVTLHAELPDEAISVVIDRERISQVVTNLVLNGVHAAGEGGEVVVAVSSTEDGVDVQVRDSGPGVPEAEQDRIFEPFFTTKAPGDGTGLGLSIVRRIVLDHGGSIEVARAPEGGASMRIHLPHRET